MDIVLNDKSLDGQFTEHNFWEYMRKEVIPSLQMFEELGCALYKEYNTYNRPVTEDKNLLAFLKMQGNPVADSLKNYLVQLSGRKPFWNDEIKTKEENDYFCKIQEIPNCITEAYERDGMVYSFQNKNFGQMHLDIKCNGIDDKVRNAFNYESARVHLSSLGIIEIWDKNSFYIRDTGYKFEIRFNEENHNIAHFHVSNADFSVSLSIPDADILAGKLPSDMQRKVVSWALKNMGNIVGLWNKTHPEKEIDYKER